MNCFIINIIKIVFLYLLNLMKTTKSQRALIQISKIKNGSESNKENSIKNEVSKENDDMLTDNGKKIYTNDNSPNIVNNILTNSLKNTNDNTKKITKTKIEKDITQNPQKKKRGRPKTKNKKKRIHTKKSKDNLRCKIKFLLLKSIREYINTKIDNKYKFGGKYFGQLLIMKKNEKESICFYREFFQKTIR